MGGTRIAGEPVGGSRGSPEETPSTGRDRRVEKIPVERPDPGTETIPASSDCDDAADAEDGLVRDGTANLRGARAK
ncbi:hypothetical protein AKJ39_02655 [candidate division MSBL1 archaeon SCGC-AAA259J03]|uniref:Uncharacterized protein n=1 Tax=candidate division MSBL1 archaeon SCGC-AAA259J03 TaxID=1698269 RepID=A0A656YZ72_9EURY|nr:hypothetical protein AKJ39_02655 [candidate division MSBL1 archaeon SCGC-AAA259J03]